MTRALAPSLCLCNEPRPAVALLAVVWPAGDPARSDWPTVIDTWARDWDDAMGGMLSRAQQRAGFSWALGSHLVVDTGGRLPFGTLLLVGATPAREADWPGWTAVGGLVGGLVAGLASGQEERRVGLLVDRIFAPGLGELAGGLFGALGSAGGLRELVITGSIGWTPQDRQAVLDAWATG